MGNFGVFLGLILPFFVRLVDLQKATVSVGDDRMVKPGKKTEVLNCIGSEGEIAYYIRNRVAWDFTDKDGSTHRLSYGFYDDSSDPYTAKLKEENRLTYEYLADPENEDYKFSITLGETSIQDREHPRNLEIGGQSAKLENLEEQDKEWSYERLVNKDPECRTFCDMHNYYIKLSDDGTYTCTLYDEGNNVIDSKSMKLTVVAPVQKLILELHDKNGILAAQQSFTQGDSPVDLAPGMYMIHCQAEGSNPEPMMSLYYNQENLIVNQTNERVTSGEGPTYTGHLHVGELNLMSKSTEQLVLCEANIAGDYYQQKKAGIKLTVKIDKPEFMCSNLTTKPGDKYQKLECELLTKPGQQAPVCRNAFWRFGDSGKMIEVRSVEKFTDPEKEYHIMESECVPIVNGLKVTLTFYTVQPIHMKTTFYIVYGVGSDSEAYPVQIYLKETSGASVITPVTLLISLMAAIFGRHIAKNL